jgi:hypothetical protein
LLTGGSYVMTAGREESRAARAEIRIELELHDARGRSTNRTRMSSLA